MKMAFQPRVDYESALEAACSQPDS